MCVYFITDIQYVLYIWMIHDLKAARNGFISYFITFDSLQVAFHLQPYKGRTDLSVHDNIKYIIDK